MTQKTDKDVQEQAITPFNTWEYMQIEVDFGSGGAEEPKGNLDTLNSLGAHGWEATDVVVKYPHRHWVLLKRPTGQITGPPAA